MEAYYIEPFAKAAENVFRTALGCEIQRKSVMLKGRGVPAHEITGQIRLTGKASGAVTLSVSPPVAFKIVAAMLDLHVDEINSDVTDAVCELTNMIAGGAKTWLSECELSLGLPEVIIGQTRTVEYPADVDPHCIYFGSAWGPFAVEIGLTRMAPAAQG
jgi:chemotaxis protein CheX